ncbi:MAG TPA: hypothetical protein VFV72_11995 [Candidatus Limnocylindrales bacterium]|nr:hypothetical protein [Candidatus Limnocylindrales bacterium]
MTLGVVTLTLAQVLDLWTFVRMIDLHGVAAEANPLVEHALAEGGVPYAGVAKLAAIAVVVAVTVVLTGKDDRRRHPRLAGSVVAVAVVAGLIGGLSNAIVLVG